MIYAIARQNFWLFPLPRGLRGVGCARLPMERQQSQHEVTCHSKSEECKANGHMDAAAFNASLKVLGQHCILVYSKGIELLLYVTFSVRVNP
jgi:hypothetical protein